MISVTFADYRLFSYVVQSFKAAWAVDGRGTNCYPPWQG